MITRTVKLPNELDARLRNRARREKVTYSEAARRALEDGLRDQKSGVNMLSALQSFAGSIAGSTDPSTNKAYLSNFGAPEKCR